MVFNYLYYGFLIVCTYIKHHTSASLSSSWWMSCKSPLPPLPHLHPTNQQILNPQPHHMTFIQTPAGANSHFITNCLLTCLLFQDSLELTLGLWSNSHLYPFITTFLHHNERFERDEMERCEGEFIRTKEGTSALGYAIILLQLS